MRAKWYYHFIFYDFYIFANANLRKVLINVENGYYYSLLVKAWKARALIMITILIYHITAS